MSPLGGEFQRTCIDATNTKNQSTRQDWVFRDANPWPPRHPAAAPCFLCSLLGNGLFIAGMLCAVQSLPGNPILPHCHVLSHPRQILRQIGGYYSNVVGEAQGRECLCCSSPGFWSSQHETEVSEYKASASPGSVGVSCFQVDGSSCVHQLIPDASKTTFYSTGTCYSLAQEHAWPTVYGN